MFKRFLICLGTTLVVMPTVVMSDVVVMKNGDRISGEVDSIVGGKLLVQTEYAGLVPVQLDAVATLSSDKELNVRVGDERKSGSFTAEDGQTLFNGEPVELAEVSSATQDNLSLVDVTRDWSSRADVSVVISNGNSKTESYNTLIESVLKSGRAQHDVALLVSNEEAEGVATKDQVDFDYGYKRFVNEKVYLAGNAEYFTDELKDIDQRITLGAGAGYQFWDNSLGAFSTEVGVSAVQEEVAGEDENNPAIRWALDYRRLLFAKKLEVFHNQSILFIPDSDRGEVLSSSTGLRYGLSDRIDTTARVDVNHETEPAPGNSKTDVTYTLGIGVKF